MLQKMQDDELKDPFPRHCLLAMKELFADKGFQGAIKCGHEYALHDNFQ